MTTTDFKYLSTEEIMSELGQRFAQVRIRQHLTQKDVAERSGIGLQTLQRLESGGVATRFSNIIKVCRTLGILQDLMGIATMPIIIESKKQRARASKKTETSKPFNWKA